MNGRPNALGWIQHPDKRRFSVSRQGDRLVASRYGVEAASRGIYQGDVVAARESLVCDVVELASEREREPTPPILSVIDRAERIARLVVERREVAARLAEIDGEIADAMNPPTQPTERQ